jgi:hypothetical protein
VVVNTDAMVERTACTSEKRVAHWTGDEIDIVARPVPQRFGRRGVDSEPK